MQELRKSYAGAVQELCRNSSPAAKQQPGSETAARQRNNSPAAEIKVVSGSSGRCGRSGCLASWLWCVRPRAVAEPPAASTTHSCSRPARRSTAPRAPDDALLELPARTPCVSKLVRLARLFSDFCPPPRAKIGKPTSKTNQQEHTGVRAGSSRSASPTARGPVPHRAGPEPECIVEPAGGWATARGEHTRGKRQGSRNHHPCCRTKAGTQEKPSRSQTENRQRHKH